MGMLMCAAALLLLLATVAAAVAPVAAAPWPKVLMNTTRYPEAVCNDGSPAAAYVARRGSGSGVIFFLEGGFWCWDTPSCSWRAAHQPNLTTSIGYPASLPGFSGLLGGDCSTNPRFCDFSVVYIRYCSSDAFAGAGTGTVSGSTWQFRGRAILAAIVDSFKDELRLSHATDVLLAGCSAGGQGVVNTADYMGTLLAKAGFSGRYRALADAGWMMDVEPISKNVPIATTFKDGQALWQGIPNAACVDAAPAGEAWTCFFTPVAASYIQTPVLIQSNQYDMFQLPWDLGKAPPYTTQEHKAFAQNLASTFRRSMDNCTNPVISTYSASCFAHCYTQGDLFTNVKINGASLSDAAVEFFFSSAKATSKKYIADCDAINCSPGCPPLP